MTGTTPEEDDRNVARRSRSAQAEVEELRLTVLAGRGPGASRAEFLRHTRGRTVVGGRPVALLREAVARDAAAARGDADELLLHVVTARSRVAADVAVLRNRWKAEPRTPRAGTSLRALARSRGIRRAVLGLIAAMAGRAVWRRMPRRAQRRPT